MNNPRELTHSVCNASITTVWSVQVMPFLMNNLSLLILPIIIVMVDLWYGVRESKEKGLEIRFSGAGWKTLRKLIDYYTVLCLGFVIGNSLPEHYGFSIQEVCFYSILLPGILDTCSIIGHVLKLHGISFNPREFIIGLIKSKNKDIGDALDKSIKEDNEK
jgi:hypothetical protein